MESGVPEISNRADVTIRHEKGAVTVAGTGSLDLTNAQEFREALETASDSADELSVDFRLVMFIDTAILEYLARAAKKMIARDKRLRIIATEGSQPLRVIRTVGFGDIMDVAAEATP